MPSKNTLEPEPACIGETAAKQLGHDIGDFCGEWIDAIWEAGNEDPTQGSHIVIAATNDGFKVSGATYSAPLFEHAIGRFWSTNTMVQPAINGLVYLYEGTERGTRSGPKNHTGVGFYRFHNSGDLGTFTGAFTAWEEDRNRRVEGRQLNKSEIFEIKQATNRKSLFEEFFLGKKERAGGESIPALDSLFSQPFQELLTKNNLDREINELKAVWGRYSLCMAFLLRTTLEKVLTKVMLKSGLRGKIVDKQNQNEFVPLNKMIEIATQEQINGLPILSQQTAKAAHLIKFLGNTAAHSLYAGVDLGSLSLSAPQIKTAISELSRHL